MKTILGIDPGLATIGYGVIQHEGSRYLHIAHGVFRTSAHDEMGIRLRQIHNDLKDILNTYGPDEAGIETLYFSKNRKSALPVSQASGVILFTLAEAGVSFSQYTPLEVKQAVIGHGKADKQQVQEVLKIFFNLADKPTPDHAADALAIAICHANYASVREGLDALGHRYV